MVNTTGLFVVAYTVWRDDPDGRGLSALDELTSFPNCSDILVSKSHFNPSVSILTSSDPIGSKPHVGP